MAGSYSSLREKRLKPSEEQAKHTPATGTEAQKVSPHILSEDVGADPLL